MSLTETAVAEFLNSLGDTPDQVRDSLVSKGVKGLICEPCMCPVARALNDEFNGYSTVGTGDVVVYDESYETRIAVPVPEGVRKFISMFDARHYPELEVK